MSKAQVNMHNGVTMITSKIKINAQKEQVWEALKSIGEIDRFHPLVKKSYATTEQKSGLGAKRHCDLLPMGQMEEEVIHWKEGDAFTLAVIGGKILPPYCFMEGHIELDPTEEETEVSFTFSYQLKYGIMGKLINIIFILPQFKKAPPQYVKGLKAFIEDS